MKAVQSTINRFIALGLLTISGTAFGSEPVGSGAGQTCGKLKSFHGDVQIFDSTRTNIGETAFGARLLCGDWISVERGGKAVIENTLGATLVVSENSFLQILDAQAGENPTHSHFALFRGETFVQPGKKEIRILSPNAIARVSDGSAFLVYATADDTTQAVGLGGKTSLENRFFPDRSVSAPFAQMVSFTNPVERLIPDASRPVNAAELIARLAKIGAGADLKTEIEKAVKIAAKAKMPVSLASNLPKPSEKASGSGELSHPAAEPIKPLAHAPKANRKIASVPSVRKAEPNFRLKRPAAEENEKKRLMQALSSMRPDEE